MDDEHDTPEEPRQSWQLGAGCRWIPYAGLVGCIAWVVNWLALPAVLGREPNPLEDSGSWIGLWAVLFLALVAFDLFVLFRK